MIRWLAKQLWDFCEFYNLKCPFAPQIFGLMVGAKSRRRVK